MSWNTRRSEENTYIGAADWRVDGHLGRFPAFLKFGTKLQSRDKDIDESSDRFANASLTLSPWSETVVGGLEGATQPFVQGAVEQFTSWADRNRGLDSLPMNSVDTEIQKIDNDAFVRERITAAYLMGNAEVGRLTALTGVRIERTDSDAEFWELGENSRLPTAQRYTFPTARSTRNNAYTNVLPAAIFKLDVRDGVVLRAAYTNSMARPQFTQLASYTRANYIPDAAVPNAFDGTVTDNNPNLKPYESTNLDFSAEYYPKTGGQLAVGYFHKSIDNPIYTFRSTERDVNFDGRYFTTLRYTQQRNGDAGDSAASSCRGRSRSTSCRAC